jgi:hypothetical protein
VESCTLISSAFLAITQNSLAGLANLTLVKKEKGKAILATGREDPWGCETSKLPHFLDNRLTDGGEAVSLTRRPSFTLPKIPGTHLY